MSFLGGAFNGLKSFLKFLLAHFYEICRDLYKAKNNIPLNQLMKDSVATVSSAGMMLIFNLLAIVLFIFLPQGQDVLMIVSEDLAAFHPASFLWLILGMIIWSVFSEFGVRYAIYVTDNSGNSLSDARVIWRRKLQKFIADIFLILPYIIVLLGMVFNRPMNDVIISARGKEIGFWVPIIVIYLLMSAVAHIYFKTVRQDDVSGNPGRKSASGRDRVYSWLQEKVILTGREKEWCEKLTGIYNPYVFSLPKSVSFRGSARQDLRQFEENFVLASREERNGFPQNPDFLTADFMVPEQFSLIRFTEDYELEKDPEDKGMSHIRRNHPNGRYRWIYHIPNRFYEKLHSRLYAVSGFSLLFLLFILLGSDGLYRGIGAPGLTVLAFACWIGIYLGLLHVDYALFRRSKPLQAGMPVPDPENPGREKYREPVHGFFSRLKGSLSLRTFLLLLLITSSLVNEDHPVRYNDAGTSGADRPAIRDHFRSWMAHYRQDTARNRFFCRKDTTHVYPVVFVCAEGGALRTGAFTSLMLGIIQDSLQSQGIDFKKSIYAYSGVSGGSLGISFFNTLAYLDQNHGTDYSYRVMGRQFFSRDYLSAVIAKSFYSEILQAVIPWYVPGFDRAVALERNWESGYESIGSYNYFGEDYLRLWRNAREDKGMHSYPAMFINTTEVETGLQCWLSNVRPDTAMHYGRERDLLHHKIRGGINYSTMINFSTRFPLVSPAVCIRQNASRKLHYVDGGYVENTGAATMTEIIKALGPVFKDLKDSGIVVRPFVIMLRFGEDEQHPQNVNFANELSEVLMGIYNVRVKMAIRELVDIVDPWKGKVISLRLAQNARQVPLNWVLSNRSIDSLDAFVIRTWQNRTKNDLAGLYCIDTANYCNVCTESSHRPGQRQRTRPKPVTAAAYPRLRHW